MAQWNVLSLVINKAVGSTTARPCAWPPCLEISNVGVSIDVRMENLGLFLCSSVGTVRILLNDDETYRLLLLFLR